MLHIGDYVKSFQSIYLALPEKCRSEDRKEYNSIRDTVRMLKKTDKFVSSSLERSQNNAKLLDVKRRLAAPEALRVCAFLFESFSLLTLGNFPDKQVSPTTKYLAEGKVSFLKKSRYYFLMSDALYITNEKRAKVLGEASYTILESVEWDYNTEVVDLPKSKEVEIRRKYANSMKEKDRKKERTTRLGFPDEAAKATGLLQLTTAVKRLIDANKALPVVSNQ